MASASNSNTHHKETPLFGILLSKVTSRMEKENKTELFKYYTMIITFLAYASYHLTRKVISVVSPVLQNGSQSEGGEQPWKPFDNADNQDLLIAGLGSGFLFAYAFGMFFCGHIAERVDLRYFLTTGMVLRQKP